MSRARPAATVLLALLLAVTVVPAPAAGADRHRRFEGSTVYRGSFPDPHVFRRAGLWVATGTTIAGRSVPMLTSLDGRVWWARPAHHKARVTTNDALLGVPRWAARKRAGKRRFVPVWAPSIGRAANGRWLLAYSAPNRRQSHRRCVGIARSRTAFGPFRHARKRPLVCVRGQNVIDPELFRTRGRTHLLWKTGGVRGRTPPVIWSRPLRRDGLGFRPGSRAHALLRPGPAWEGPVIENPSMIRFRGRLYLFYSGNRWYSRNYAVGYAVCRSVTGPCRRPQRRPLLASGRKIAGPGGQSALRGPGGRLLLAYAAWPGGRVGTRRQLHVATLKVRPKGRLVVVRRHRGHR